MSQQVLKGMGVQQLDRRSYGDMYLHFQVQIPNGSSLSSEQKEALKLFSPPTAADSKDSGTAEWPVLLPQATCNEPCPSFKSLMCSTSMRIASASPPHETAGPASDAA
jgi:hypothetical protein